MPTPKLYRRQAEDCVELANEATELYAKTALLELAAEFRESAERLEHRMQEPKGQFAFRFSLKRSFSFDC
jgi:molecular chaperone GrpE (heat shock protein)